MKFLLRISVFWILRIVLYSAVFCCLLFVLVFLLLQLKNI